MSAMEPIAIIGMAGRFPGSDTIEEFWANLAAGRDCLTEISDEELLRYHEDPELIARPDYIRKRPILPDSDSFDAQLFGMTPREAELRDPQYRLMLETVHATLEHGGYDPSDYTGHIGLFAGTNVNRYRYDYIERRRDVVRSAGFLSIDVANHPDYLSTFISYKLGLRGPSATLLTACSTSLVAVHLAATAIRAGDCDMAVAGGVDLEFPYHRGYIYTDGGIAAQDGTPRTFDADATGTNFGDGVGAVLLKPLSAARRDGDTVYATILSSSVNNDGNRKVGYTAPSVQGQSECISRALTQAGVSPRDIDYLEAHGTATKVGDPIELSGLIDAYRSVSAEPLPAQYCAIGSVKASIGHLGQAAGVAALIKATLALTHRQIPPSINMSVPNPAVDWATSPFYVNTELRDWPAHPDRPRLAGVSSFGIGGTNAHLILAEAAPHAAEPSTSNSAETLLWSAMDDTAADQLRERLAEHFGKADPTRFADAAHTLRVGRSDLPVRYALRAKDSADAASALRTPERLWRSDGVSRGTVFAFPGQGGLHPHACRELYDAEPVFRGGCDAAFEILRPLLDKDLRAVWQSATDPAELAATDIAQPLLFTFEYALAHSLIHWGVQPSAVFGHSLGELAAAAVAGVFDFESGLRAVAARAKAMAAMPPGRMLAVADGVDAVRDLVGGEVALAAINGSRQVVLSGPAEALDAAAEALAARQVKSKPLNTSHAFHSPSMAGATDEFRAALAGLTLHAPIIPLISAATGEQVGDEQACSPDFWTRQLLEPVDFDAAAATVLADGPVTICEVGPGSTLTSLLRGRSDVRGRQSRVQTCSPDNGTPVLADVLARLWVDGVPVRYWRDRPADGRGRVAVPGYPYQRQRYWLDAPPMREDRTPPSATPKKAVEAPKPLGRWEFAQLEWVPDRAAVRSRAVTLPSNGTAVLLVPDDAAIARPVQAALQRAGFRTHKVSTGQGSFDPTAPEDWLALLDKHAPTDGGSVVIGHAALLDPGSADADQDGVVGIVESVRGALRAAVTFQRKRKIPTRILVVGSGLADITGAEAVNPAAAAVVPMVRTMAQENPGLVCQVVDIVGTPAENLLSDAVAGADHPLVALRGSQRWLPRLQVFEPHGAAGGLLRAHGTYVISGGLGGVGAAVARALAETGLAPRLALLGRRAPADLPEPARTRVLTEIDALVDAGADVEVLSCDVGDPAALAAAVDTVQQRFGPVNGVIHAAGVAGGGLLERRTPEQVAAVLYPKVAGTRALEEVFARRAPLDFLMLFSSQAGLSGLYGSADYAAANAYLDAHARRRHALGHRTISVQWPGWAEVGMVADSPEAKAVLAPAPAPPARTADTLVSTEDEIVYTTVKVPGQDWEFDEHVFDGTPVLPGTALLEFVVRTARQAGLVPAGRALELKGTAFLAAIVGDRARQVRIVLNPMAGVHRFRVQARPAGGDEPWTDHATGTLVATDPLSTPGIPALPASEGSAPSREKVGLAGWMSFGPRWHTMTETRSAAGERLTRMVLPDRFHGELADHPMHAALLDVAAGVLTDLEPGKAYAPFLYRRLLHQGPLTADITVHARFAKGGRRPRAVDFDIYDTASGELLLRVESFTMREVVGNVGFTPETAADPRRSAPTNDTGGLLLPADGAAAFLDLLAEDAPPVVFVGVPSSRLDVPGVPWSDQVAPSPAAPTVPVSKPAPVPVPAHSDDVLTGLLKLWRDALGVQDISPDDDFFELGGNSLAAVQLAARISASFGVELGAGMLFDASTPKSLAAEISANA
jgi:phthiocerol/phenolphthiocerol synthesis type-I polyketide synthase E